MIENKIDFCRSSGCGGSQRLDRAKPSFSFSFKKTKGGFTRGVRWMICKSSSSVTWINRAVFIGKARIVVHPGVYSSFSYDISCFVALKLTQPLRMQKIIKKERTDALFCWISNNKMISRDATLSLRGFVWTVTVRIRLKTQKVRTTC